MLSKPITLMSFEVGSDLVAIDQLAATCSGVALFDFHAGFGQPLFVFAKQFQCPADYFFRIVIRPGAQYFIDQSLMFGSKSDGHTYFLSLSPYRASQIRVKPMSVDFTGKPVPDGQIARRDAPRFGRNCLMLRLFKAPLNAAQVRSCHEREFAVSRNRDRRYP